MLDHFAIHIEDVQRTIWRICKLARPKPNIARRYKLALFVDPPPYKAHTIRLQLFSMHEVAAELNTHSGRAMNGAAWDAGQVLGVLRLNEAIHRNDAILRAERAIRMTGVS